MKIGQITASLAAHLKAALQKAQAEFNAIGPKFEEAHCVVSHGGLEYRVASAHYRENHQSGHLELVHVTDDSIPGALPPTSTTVVVESQPEPVTATNQVGGDAAEGEPVSGVGTRDEAQAQPEAAAATASEPAQAAPAS